MFDVITFGSATRDVFLRSKALELHREHGIMEACFPFGAKLAIDDIVLETGGGATNNAVTFSRLFKLRTAVVTRIGNDLTGEEIIKALKQDRVNTAFVQRSKKEKTGYSTILLSNEAERTILTYRGASAGIDADEIDWEEISAKLFHISSLGGDLDLLRKIISRAKKIGAEICFNPGNGELEHGRATLAPILAKVDLLSLNREEASALTGKKDADLRGIIKAIRKLAVRSIVTDGRKGAYAVSPSETLHAAIIPSKRINLTGAGDAFTSAYAAGLHLTHNIKFALAVGTHNATGVVKHMGAKVGILKSVPAKAELAKVKIKKINF
jgi:ribokinase